MRAAVLLVTAFGVTTGQATAGPKQLLPVGLDPAGPWNAHSENEVCKLRRSFGPENNRVSIELARFGPASSMQLALFGNALKQIYKGRSYTVAFGSLPAHSSIGAMTARDSNGTEVSLLRLPGLGASPEDIRKAAEAVAAGRPTTADSELAASVITLTIAIKGEAPLVLKVGSLAKPYAIWNQCIDAMVVNWGLDPKVRFSTAPVPIGNPGVWILPKDYPAKALDQYKGGLIYFRLSIDAGGKPTQCAIQRAVNEGEFAQSTCSVLMKRARFQPARDASGNPVPSFWQSSARFNVSG